MMKKKTKQLRTLTGVFRGIVNTKTFPLFCTVMLGIFETVLFYVLGSVISISCGSGNNQS